MSRIHIQFLDQEFHRVLFDAVPVPIFVVDAEVSVLDYNTAAGRLALNDVPFDAGNEDGDFQTLAVVVDLATCAVLGIKG